MRLLRLVTSVIKIIPIYSFLALSYLLIISLTQSTSYAEPLGEASYKRLLQSFKLKKPWSVDVVGGKPPSSLDIPEKWKPENFNPLDLQADKFGLYRLRDVTLLNDDLEIRIWIIKESYYRIENVLLRRISGKWEGLVYDSKTAYTTGTMRVLKPSSDWQTVWNELDRLGILELPDQSLLPISRKTLNIIFDGVTYVVEVNCNDTYRIYEYSNPRKRYWPEAKKFFSIIRFFEIELGTDISELGLGTVEKLVEDDNKNSIKNIPDKIKS